MINTKVILVTGGSSGIGYEAAQRLARMGHKVYAAARRTALMEPLVADGVTPLALDVTDDASRRQCVDTILKAEGRIDVLVNNAGYGYFGAVEGVPPDDARRQLEVNVFGLAEMTRLVLPAMRSQRSGRIVNIASIAGRAVFPFGGWYNVSKYSVEALSDALRMELKPFGITLTAVLPGDTKTGFTAARQKIDDPEDLYGGRIERSVQRMECDEQHGVPAQKVGDLIARVALKRRVKPLYIPGFSYNLVNVLMRLLPSGAANKLIGMLYAK